MPVSIRPLDYGHDTQDVLDVLQTNLPYRPHARLFQWLYLDNPEGRALGWVAEEPGDQRIVGIAAAFPRRLYCKGAEERGYVLGDFCIDARHRSLGLALALQRACLEGISNAAFAFDFPSRAMVAVYRRLGIEATEYMIRHAKPLRVDRKLNEKLRFPVIAGALTAVINAGLGLRDCALGHGGQWRIVAESGHPNEEFTAAGREWTPPGAIAVARTAEYLTWRYRDHPYRRYEMLTARQGGKLCGYLVYHLHGDEVWTIDDLMGQDNEVRKALVIASVRLARERGIQTLSASWLAGHAGGRVLARCGFRPRETSPVVPLPAAGCGGRGPRVCAADWYLTDGDRES